MLHGKVIDVVVIGHGIRVRNRGNLPDFVDGGVPRDSRPGPNKMSCRLPPQSIRRQGFRDLTRIIEAA